MHKNNIEVRPLWKPMHLQPFFKKNRNHSLEVSTNLFKSGICLPSSPNLSNGDIDRVLTILIKCLKKF